MAKKNIFFLTVSLLLFFSLPSHQNFGGGGLSSFVSAGESALEISYPTIPGVAAPKTVADKLPDYVDYIFRLSVIIIGFFILGVLVYSGVQYLLSTGNPSKISDAREGILAGFLGAVILLSAYLIFNTINPQLTILELPPVTILAAVVTPGVYICNYTISDIGGILNDYIQKGPQADFNRDKQTEAVKELKKIMVKSTPAGCPKVNFSGNFNNFVVGETNTMFIIPRIEIINDKRVPIYEYGIVLHEKNDFRGKCRVYAKESPTGLIYSRKNDVGDYSEHQFDGYRPIGLGFTAKSLTIFKKPTQEPLASGGVTLYTCFDRNRISCPKGVTAAERTFSPGGQDIQSWMGTSGETFYENTRSVDMNPEGSFFVIFNDNKDDFYKGACAVVKTFRSNTLPMPIELCGNCQFWHHLFAFWLWDEDCRPCIRSLIVIKGLAL